MRLRVRVDSPDAVRELRHLPPGPKKEIRAALRKLIVDPLGREPRLDVRRLHGEVPDIAFFRLRLGDWRVVYTFDATTIFIMRVIHRSEGYDWFDRMDQRFYDSEGF